MRPDSANKVVTIGRKLVFPKEYKKQKGPKIEADQKLFLRICSYFLSALKNNNHNINEIFREETM